MRNPLQCRTIFFKVKSVIFFAGRTLCGPKGSLPIVADDRATRHASENFFCSCVIVAGNCALCLLHVCVLLDHLKYKYALGIQISFMPDVGWRLHQTSFNSSSLAQRPAQMRKQRSESETNFHQEFFKLSRFVFRRDRPCFHGDVRLRRFSLWCHEFFLRDLHCRSPSRV